MEYGRELDDYSTPEEKYRDEKAAKAKISNLTDAMAILLRLRGMFFEVDEEATRRAYDAAKAKGPGLHGAVELPCTLEVREISFPVLLDNQYKADKDAHLYSKQAFADAEADIIEAMLGKVKELAEPTYYGKDTSFKRAGDYISFLRGISAGETFASSSTNPKGRPKASKNTDFKTLLNCTDDEKDKIIKVLREKHTPGSGKGVVRVLLALEKKDYYLRPTARASAWNALRGILGNISSNSNLDSLYNSIKHNTVGEGIYEIRKELP